ncbi:hypothetical protein [Streptomyces sp.]|uniref:hypothetical protein n=1 Tax=Streptomyces sp. TaxID=1931 RepID=UPI0025DF36BC|nr:hypothetical protein [Streptomyces sp.]
MSREIRRNRTLTPNGGRHYRPHAAQRRTDARSPRPEPRKTSKTSQNPRLRDFLQDHMPRSGVLTSKAAGN